MSKDLEKIEFILEKIEDAQSFVSRYDSIHSALSDKMGFDAILMCLVQIGETLNKLEDEYAVLDKEDIKGAYSIRNFIAHDYEGINKSIVEGVLRIHLPKLKSALNEVAINLGSY
jgi:uncharacterized protein with HEPN domain